MSAGTGAYTLNSTNIQSTSTTTNVNAGNTEFGNSGITNVPSPTSGLSTSSLIIIGVGVIAVLWVLKGHK